MNFAEFKNAVITAAQAKGIAEYELYYKVSESTSLSTFKGEVNEFTASNEGGVCFRCIVDGKMGYASTECLSPEEAVAVVNRAADNAATLESEDPVFLGEGGQTYDALEIPQVELPSSSRSAVKSSFVASAILIARTAKADAIAFAAASVFPVVLP